MSVGYGSRPYCARTRMAPEVTTRRSFEDQVPPDTRTHSGFRTLPTTNHVNRGTKVCAAVHNRYSTGTAAYSSNRPKRGSAQFCSIDARHPVDLAAAVRGGGMTIPRYRTKYGPITTRQRPQVQTSAATVTDGPTKEPMTL